MAEVMLVSGFVPIPGHPNENLYSSLGERLEVLPVRKKIFYGTVERCWMSAFLRWLPQGDRSVYTSPPITHSVGDNSEKNTLSYHIVQHQKVEWLYIASLIQPDAEVLVWVDYGIFHVPGIYEDNLRAFLHRCEGEKHIRLPGCRQPSINPDGGARLYEDGWPDWRYCGGIIVCNRSRIETFRESFRALAEKRIIASRNVTWEVNTLARLEGSGACPMRWYQADHNQTMVENYEG